MSKLSQLSAQARKLNTQYRRAKSRLEAHDTPANRREVQRLEAALRRIDDETQQLIRSWNKATGGHVMKRRPLWSLETRQQLLFKLDIDYRRVKPQDIGRLGEETAWLQLERCGYLVAGRHPGENAGDLLAIDQGTGEAWSVEVKTARINSEGKWKFCLTKPGKTCHKNADVLLLLAVLPDFIEVCPFVIPTGDCNVKPIQLASHPVTYAGKWARYRQKSRNIILGDSPPTPNTKTSPPSIAAIGGQA